MKKIINDITKLTYEPFNNYGKPVKGMSWHKISYDRETGQGSYILKFEPGTKSLNHTHVNFEEFYVLDGELLDEDNTIFKKGDFVSFQPGTHHSSYSKNGCFLLVFMREKNELI